MCEKTVQKWMSEGRIVLKMYGCKSWTIDEDVWRRRVGVLEIKCLKMFEVV